MDIKDEIENNKHLYEELKRNANRIRDKVIRGEYTINILEKCIEKLV